MSKDRVDILFPVGRLIMGSCYKGSDKDSNGQPRIVKTGPNKGQPSTQFFLGVAIPKAGEAHWSQTAWGQQILAVGAAAWPNVYQAPTFAWKIDDGDSAVPNKKGRKPCDQEGARGHWVLKFTSGFAPKVFTQPTAGTFVEQTAPDVIKPGYHLQVAGSVAGNGSTESPGVYLNHGMALFVRADTEITSGPDAASAFAGAALSQALPGGAAPIPFSAPVAVAVAPNPAILAVRPALPVAPALPTPALPTPVPVAQPALTAQGQASGFSYEQWRAAGHSDDALRAAGIIQ